MSRKSISGNAELAQAIRARRNELNFTIEEAANRAGIGIKTWCRYEAGESIRQDKSKGLCRALNWRALPVAGEIGEPAFSLDEYRANEYWSTELEERFGATAAASFIIGSEILEDHINEDLAELSQMPRGSHIGELAASFIADDLPPQFLPRYDYEFLYALRCALRRLKARIKYNSGLVAHSVMDELALYLIVEESRMLLEDGDYIPEDGWDEWIFDVFYDMDIITLLYSNRYLTEDNIYHFDHWTEEQFCLDQHQ